MAERQPEMVAWMNRLLDRWIIFGGWRDKAGWLDGMDR
jgi:hypothetical protein